MSVSPFIGWDDAMRFIRSEPDRTIRQLLSLIAATIARHHGQQDTVPSAPLDMVFLMKTVREAFEDKDVVRAILEDRYRGEWFDDEE